MMTLQQLSTQLATNNLELIAGKLNIQSSAALEIQADMWPNPNLQIGQNIYNHETKKYFDVGPNGNTDFSLTQTIRLGDKRKSEKAIASYETKIAEQTLRERLRNVNHDLRESFYRAYFQHQTLLFFDRSIQTIQNTVAKTQKSYEGRSVLLSEVFRLKAILVALQNQRMDVLSSWSDTQLALKKLVWGENKRIDYDIIPELDLDQLDKSVINKSYDEYLSVARQKRPDFLTASFAVEEEKAKLEFEKAQAIPDLAVGVAYSKSGGYIKDYYALTLGMDLPIFNRNQGKISAETFAAKSKETEKTRAEGELEYELKSIYNKAVTLDKAYHEVDRGFSKEYSALAAQMVTNYQNRNISIIAFADFFEAYREGLIQSNEIQLKRLLACEELNRAVGEIVLLP
ncbi:MAG: TolC family protein [Chitinophagaceae bacterium]|nr:TolC family protein [Oligoflexus sp.]